MREDNAATFTSAKWRTVKDAGRGPVRNPAGKMSIRLRNVWRVVYNPP